MAKKRRHALMKQYAHPQFREFIDFDYLDQLTDTQLEWLNTFAREWYHARFTTTDQDLHTTEEQRKAIYKSNYARQADIWNKHDRQDEPPEDKE